jgi:hypothetical protein
MDVPTERESWALTSSIEKISVDSERLACALRWRPLGYVRYMRRKNGLEFFVSTRLSLDAAMGILRFELRNKDVSSLVIIELDNVDKVYIAAFVYFCHTVIVICNA